MRQFLIRTYLGFDPRSLGLFRIVFGLVLLFDLYNHAQVIDFFYVDGGLLPGDALIASQPTRRMFSLFFLASTSTTVGVGMGICAAVYTAYTIGWHTRLFTVLAFVCLISLNGRIALLDSGGDAVMNLLAMWTMFLPLGRRFSLDALLVSMRARVETRPEQLGDRDPIAPVVEPVVSLAVLAVLIQLSCIYLFAGIQKNGATWSDGTAVHYALHQDQIVTVLGVWLRDYAPLALLSLVGWATRALEVGAPLLILSPLWTRHTRLVAILLFPAMHLSFAASMNIGAFSYAMSAFFPLLIAREHWDALAVFIARRTRSRTVLFDSDCGICWLTVRVLARLDGLNRLRFESNQNLEAYPDGVTPELTETTVIVIDDASGRWVGRSHGVAEALRALPFGFVAAAVVRTPGLRSVFDVLYDAVSINRTQVSRRLGLAACGIPLAPPVETHPGRSATVSRVSARRLGRLAAEVGVAVMLVASYGRLAHDNYAIPRDLQVRQAEWLRDLIDYPRLVQPWRMFSPDAPPQEFWLGVEAVTASGRAVDPFNEVAGRHPGPRFDRIPERLGFDQFFADYVLLAARGDLLAYQRALVDWILQYPERTGQPDDRIVRFDLVKISDVSPAPGESRSSDVRKTVLFRYPPPPRKS